MGSISLSTEDDYYQPVVEDFGANMEYDLPEW